MAPRAWSASVRERLGKCWNCEPMTVPFARVVPTRVAAQGLLPPRKRAQILGAWWRG